MDCDPFAPHVDSFNYLIEEGLDLAVKDVVPEELKHPDGAIIKLEYTGASLKYPSLASEGTNNIKSMKLYPMEARQRGITYSGKLKCSYAISVNDRRVSEFDRILGDVPIMVMSKLCNLSGLDGKGLVRRGEEETEKGGFFVVKGNDKVLRLLILMRQNFPMALVRSRWRQRGNFFTEFGVMIRCVKGNHSSVTHTIHYLSTRRIMFCFTWMKEQFFIPAGFLLKALSSMPDKFTHEALLRGRHDDDSWRGCVENMMRDVKTQGIATTDDALKHLGSLFRMPLQCPEWYSDLEVGKQFLRRCVLIHLAANQDKFNFFVYAIHKLVALVRGECKEESPDNPIFQQVALPGHTMLMLLKEKLKASLRKVRFYLNELLEKKGPGNPLTTDTVERAFSKATGKEIGRILEYFLATGNLVSNGEVVMPQANGFAIMAERINHFRYVSHFRGIHRGAVFQDMRTTDVRKLRPEAWGFICPVHTPDGGPCGLLNHLASGCSVTCTDGPTDQVLTILHESGLMNVDEAILIQRDRNLYPVLVNGLFVGYLDEQGAKSCVGVLRNSKTIDGTISPYTEVVLVPKTEFPNLYPSLFVFTNAGRMTRPVHNLGIKDRTTKTPAIEYIGTFEQIYLNICVTPYEFEEKVTTHQEISPSAMLSYIASLIPYPDHNQSPRNVYQCQMSKQTMGTTAHALRNRVDNKLYRLQTPQSPFVKTASYDRYEIDRYPLGTNAIVAVISYTGYDMEDGMVVNKASYERGFARGFVYKCERVDLTKLRGSKPGQTVFARDPNKEHLAAFLDADGLPHIGRKCVEGDPFYCYVDLDTGIYKVKLFKSAESCYIDTIKACGAADGEMRLDHVVITMRIVRNPNIGDKFASRHGQKGICSFLWPVENMPFTESGMVPDIIFNPHGFPSRMTVGMMIESMAGKSAMSHGVRHDATPFIYNEEFPAVQYFGECLRKAGFNHYGNESMYSGVDGREFKVQIFFGVVYYQRLRHMVADKFQVRATGPIDPLTRQPVKGRKRAGGVRFGEMERDSLISHGVSMLLHDRLFASSDKDVAQICSKCGSYISVMLQIPENKRGQTSRNAVENGEDDTCDDTDDEEIIIQQAKVPYCRACKSSEHVKMIALPHVFKYLIAELVCVNVKVKFNVK